MFGKIFKGILFLFVALTLTTAEGRLVEVLVTSRSKVDLPGMFLYYQLLGATVVFTGGLLFSLWIWTLKRLTR